MDASNRYHLTDQVTCIGSTYRILAIIWREDSICLTRTLERSNNKRLLVWLVRLEGLILDECRRLLLLPLGLASDASWRCGGTGFGGLRLLRRNGHTFDDRLALLMGLNRSRRCVSRQLIRCDHGVAIDTVGYLNGKLLWILVKHKILTQELHVLHSGVHLDRHRVRGLPLTGLDHLHLSLKPLDHAHAGTGLDESLAIGSVECGPQVLARSGDY